MPNWPTRCLIQLLRRWQKSRICLWLPLIGGGHYRWPGWRTRISGAKLTLYVSQSMFFWQRTCEGFCGQLKSELFYPQGWLEGGDPRAIHSGSGFLHPQYNKKRIKVSLGGLTPIGIKRALELRHKAVQVFICILDGPALLGINTHSLRMRAMRSIAPIPIGYRRMTTTSRLIASRCGGDAPNARALCLACTLQLSGLDLDAADGRGSLGGCHAENPCGQCHH